MENNIIEDYQKNKQALNKIENEYGLRLGNVLSDRLWKGLKVSQKDIAIRIIYNLFFKQYTVACNENVQSSNLVVWFDDFQKTRKDHETIFNNAKSLIKEYNYIILKKGKQFTPIRFFKKAGITRKFYREFRFCKDKFLRFYLSSMMCVIDDLYDMVQKERLLEGKRSLLVFQDCDLVSNMIVQLMQRQNACTVELQHGQWLYRNKPYDDYLNIANFTADYFLAWNEFTKQQFLNAGYEPKRMVVAGATKYLYEKEDTADSLSKEQKRVFGVVLDTPVYTYAEKYNYEILQIAENIAEKEDMQYYIKLHPFDEKEHYRAFLDSKRCVGCVERSESMKEYASKVDFSLAHTTGASVDLMILGAFVFLYKTEIQYPLLTDCFFEFRAEDELIESIRKLYSDWENYCKLYEEVQKNYYTENALEKHQKFFDCFFNGQ